MFNFISELLISEGVKLFAPVPLGNCKITKKYLLERAGISDGTVIMCAVPYMSFDCTKSHNISAYASVRDYHVFYAQLWERICTKLRQAFPDNIFVGFADHSPVDERDAAAIAGLGVIGENGLLITEEYSSYVFLGELITNSKIPCKAQEIKHCISCGKCKSECPLDKLGQCLSALTQKKGELSPDEAEALIEYNTSWGCDICQVVCPYTQKAISNKTIFTDIEYFLTDVIPDLDLGLLNALDDQSFSSRAFAWRGRDTIRRNLEILEKYHNKQR